MARPRTAAGELGAVQLTRLASRTWRARARIRDDSGVLVPLRADAATEDTARTELLARAAALASHTTALVRSPRPAFGHVSQAELRDAPPETRSDHSNVTKPMAIRTPTTTWLYSASRFSRTRRFSR